jgi:ribose-phosphate pyrophosphokinase
VIVTDSIPVPPNKQLPQLKVISIARLIGEAIKRIHCNESVSRLFER